MTQLRKLAVIGAVAAAFLGVNTEAQRRQKPPSIAFGTAEVSLGMSVEEVQKNLSESARHIEFMGDKHTALVRVNNAPVPSGDDSRGRPIASVLTPPARVG
jgi:hypothetical protein